MRYFFYLLSISVLLSVTGCVIVPGHRDRDDHGDHWEHHDDHGDWHGGDHDEDHGDHD